MNQLFCAPNAACASGDAARPGAEACCLGETLKGSQVSLQHSKPQQMALDVNCFNCVGFVCSASQGRGSCMEQPVLPACLLKNVNWAIQKEDPFDSALKGKFRYF